MALNNGVRSVAKQLISTSESILSVKPGTRGFHSTGVKRMGGHGHDEPYYMHAKHMYNLDRMKYRNIKIPLFVLGMFSVGCAVPIYGVIFQQRKTKSS